MITFYTWELLLLRRRPPLLLILQLFLPGGSKITKKLRNMFGSEPTLAGRIIIIKTEFD